MRQLACRVTSEDTQKPGRPMRPELDDYHEATPLWIGPPQKCAETALHREGKSAPMGCEGGSGRLTGPSGIITL